MGARGIPGSLPPARRDAARRDAAGGAVPARSRVGRRERRGRRRGRAGAGPGLCEVTQRALRGPRCPRSSLRAGRLRQRETRGEGTGGAPAPETGEMIKLSSAKHCGVFGLGRD